MADHLYQRYHDNGKPPLTQYAMTLFAHTSCHVSVRACMRVCMRACVCVCVCVFSFLIKAGQTDKGHYYFEQMP